MYIRKGAFEMISKEIGIKNGSSVDVKIVDGVMVVKPKVYSLKELLDQVTPENLHGEIKTGEQVGKEEW
jgi:antitoxin MazE